MIYFIVIIGLIIFFGPHLWAAQVLNRYNRQEYFSGSGISLARMIIPELGLKHVTVEVVDTGDHYDPEKKAVRLSRKRCGRRTLTAVVVAAHEVGHAVQDHYQYRPLRTRMRLIRIAARLERMGAGVILLVPLFTAFVRVPAASVLMLAGGFATLCIPVIIHLLTLPTEFDASFNRALPILTTGKYIPQEDIPAARRILLACSLTYVAGALIGLLNVWRWIRLIRR
jgi:Zn-dependent membrane protease YugP